MQKTESKTCLIISALNVLLMLGCGNVLGSKSGGYGLSADSPNAEQDVLAGSVAPKIGGTDELRGNNLTLPGIEVGSSTSYTVPQSDRNLLVIFESYDIDAFDEVEILADGISLGFLPQGSSNSLSGALEILLPVGTQALEFRQDVNPDFRWGVVLRSASWVED